MEIYNQLKHSMRNYLQKYHLEGEEVTIRAAPLSTDEAIGNPEDRDYPLITGRERMMQAEFKGALGQAYTDMYGDYTGKVSDIVEMEMSNNFRRAIFIAGLNAVMRHLGLIDQTIHCKDNEPRECAFHLNKYILKKYGRPKIAMVGLQPRMVETLSQDFDVRVTDLDNANINTKKCGVMVQDPEKSQENMKWCDLAIVTGSTIVNNSIGHFLTDKPVVFFGVTIAGAAKILDLENFCFCAT